MTKTEKQYSTHYVKRLRGQINKLKALLDWKDRLLVIFTGVIALFAIFQYCSFEKFSKKNSRAYLSVVNPVLDTLKTYGVEPRVTYTIQNTGNTPAYEVTSIIYLEKYWKSIGPQMPDTTNRAKYIYAPGNIEQTRLFKQVNPIKKSPLENDELRTFFFGRIEYSDIFEQCHWLTFAYEYVWRHDSAGKFHAYPEYNDTDKN